MMAPLIGTKVDDIMMFRKINKKTLNIIAPDSRRIITRHAEEDDMELTGHLLTKIAQSWFDNDQLW